MFSPVHVLPKTGARFAAMLDLCKTSVENHDDQDLVQGGLKESRGSPRSGLIRPASRLSPS